MADSTNPEKLQMPLQDKDGPFYPLTTYDQIIMPDGVSRWDGQSDALTSDDRESDGSEEYSAIPIDADTFNGMTFEQLKKAIMAEAVYQ